MPDNTPPDSEANRLSARAARYASVGVTMGGVGVRMLASRLLSGGQNALDPKAANAAALALALGNLKGPLMKIAQLVATIPDLLPPDYAAELQKLQADAPPMGPLFVKRRMQTELGMHWQTKFQSFDMRPAQAASLGQVHRAVSLEGTNLACKLQYPDMASAVEADLTQLEILFAIHKRLDRAIDTSQIAVEIGARVREELDYQREAKHAKLYQHILADEPRVRVPAPHDDLSTERLLTLTWLEGARLLSFKDAPQESRNAIGEAMFAAWWHPFAHYGVIHGDPHLGNYTVFEDAPNAPAPIGLNLLDYGCIRIFPPKFVGGVVDLYLGLKTNDTARIVHAYETWGFQGLTRELIDVLNIWARFIYGPLLDDRVRTIADGVSPAEYGRREAFQVHTALREKGPITIPREFVFMDRAAIGLGGVFLHLQAKLNFHDLFNAEISNFNLETVAERQAQALAGVGLAQA